MIHNYFKAALRSLKRGKIITLINLLGMAIGLTASSLIYIYTSHELSIDDFEDVDHKYRLELQQRSDQSPKWAINHVSWAENYADRISEINYFVQVKDYGPNKKVTVEGREFIEEKLYVTTPKIIDYLDLELVHSSANDPLGDPNHAIISEDYALKYFGTPNPLGKEILVDDQDRFIVSGVFRQKVLNHMQADIYLGYNEKIHHRSWIYLYLQLHPGADTEKVEHQINEMATELADPFYNDTEYALVPLKDIYFHSTSKYQHSKKGNLTIVMILAVIGALILIVAGINFINLTTAIFLKRNKEVGLRKVLGSNVVHIFLRFLVEVVLILTAVYILCSILIYIAIPQINQSFGVNLGIMRSIWDLLLMGAGIFLCFAILTSFIPTIYLNVVNLTTSLKRKKGKASSNPLVVFQFAIATMLLIGTFLVKEQLALLLERDLGYGDEQILLIHLQDEDNWNKSTSFISRFEKSNGVISATSIMGAPGDGGMMGNQNAWAEGMAPGENLFLPLYAGGETLFETMGWEIIEGRDFSDGIQVGDSTGAIVLNEAAVRQFGWEDPIGKRMIISGEDWVVVGVVKDFHFLSLHHTIGPLGIQYQHNNYIMALRLRAQNLPETMQFIEETWQEIDPKRPLSSFFLDENFEKQYLNESRLDTILEILMLLSIVVSVIGTLGMVMLIMEDKLKEIGIRKVLGASIGQILYLLNRKMVFILIAANVIAWPIAWYAVSGWLDTFAYRVSISLWVFAGAGMVSIFVALLTLSFHSWKAAKTNPAEVLRSE